MDVVTISHLSGSRQGSNQPFVKPLVTFGRDPSNDVSFDPVADGEVSSFHAQINFAEGQGFQIVDVGSRNGTFVNGQKIEGTMPLMPGSIIELGKGGPKVRFATQAAPAAPAPKPIPEPTRAGPGKRTQMFEQKEKQFESQQKSSKMLVGCLGLFVLLLAAGGVGGFFYVQHLNEKKDAEAAVKEASDAQERADEAKAKDVAEVARDYSKAETLLADARAALGKGDFSGATSRAREARDTFGQAALRAESQRERLALLAQIQGSDAEARARDQAAREARERELRAQFDAEQQRARDEARRAREELERRLAEAEAARAASPSDTAPVDTGIDAAAVTSALDSIERDPEAMSAEEREALLQRLREQLEASPDEALQARLRELEERLASRESDADRLRRARDQALPAVVLIRTTVVARTEGQEFAICEATGTGFCIAGGQIVTTKHAVEPWRFDPEALAKKTRLEGYGLTIETRVRVYVRGEGGAFALRWDTGASTLRLGAGLPDEEGPEVTARIDLGAGEESVPVRPHPRNANDVYVLVLAAGAEAPAHALELAEAGAQSLAPVVALGLRTMGSEEPPPVERAEFSAQVQSAGSQQTIAAPALSETAGGPVLGADGKVVAMMRGGEGSVVDLAGTGSLRDAIARAPAGN